MADGKNMIHNNKKKIVIISDRVYPYFKGGAEKRYWEISKYLTSLNYEICFLTGQWPPMPKKQIVEGINLKGVYRVGEFYVNGRKSIWETIKYTLSLVLFLAFDQYDLIECEQFPILPIFVCKIFSLLRKKALIVTWHEVWAKELWIPYLGCFGHIGAFIELLSTHLPDRIISVSPQTTYKLIHLFNISPNSIETIPNGFDLNWDARRAKDSGTLTNIANKTNLVLDKRIPVECSDVIFVGRLLEHKNVDVLIRAIKILSKDNPNVRCLIVGDGPERKNLEELVNTLGIQQNVNFMGFIKSEKRIYSMMKASKVFVLPSTREGFGISVLEAHACGLPAIVISEKNNAACGLIKNGTNGYTSELDEAMIAQLIIRVLNSPKNNFVEACCKSVEDYSWKKIGERVNELYSKLLDQQQKDPVAVIKLKSQSARLKARKRV